MSRDIGETISRHPDVSHGALGNEGHKIATKKKHEKVTSKAQTLFFFQTDKGQEVFLSFPSDRSIFSTFVGGLKTLRSLRKERQTQKSSQKGKG